jgi:dihydroflavonol-4-reductase
MRVVITGASGFLGPHLRDAFTDSDVVGLCRNPTGDWHVAGDVLEPSTLLAAFEGADVVVHAAGGVAHTADDAGAMQAVHVQGTQNVLEAALQAGVSRVVHVSTSGTAAVSTDPNAVGNEDSDDVLPIVKGWPYYRAKLFAEQAAMAFEGLDVFVINPTLLLGPGDARGSSTSSVQLFLDGQIPAAPSGGLSFVDVRDVAAAVPLVLERGQPRRRHLLGAANMTFAAYYERLARVADLPPPKVRLPQGTGAFLSWIPDALRTKVADTFGVDRVELEMASHYWYLDSRRAQTELGWAPRDPSETLLDTVEDLRSRA